MKRMSLLIVLIMVLVMGLFISCEQPTTTYNEHITEQPSITKVSAIADYNSNTTYYVGDIVEITWVVTLSNNIEISEEPISETPSLGDNIFTYKNDNQVVIGTITINAIDNNNDTPTTTRTLQSISGVLSNTRNNASNYVVGDTVTITWTKHYNLAPLTETEIESYTLISGDIGNKSFIYTDTEYNSNEIVVVDKSIKSTTPSHVWERNGNNALWITWSLVVTYNNGETFPLTTNKTNYNLASDNTPTYSWTDYNITDSITFNKYMFDGQNSILYYENVKDLLKDMNYKVLIKSNTIYKMGQYNNCTETIIKTLDTDNMSISVILKYGEMSLYTTTISVSVNNDNIITLSSCLDFTYGTNYVSTGAYYFASSTKYRNANKSDITNFNTLFSIIQ